MDKYIGKKLEGRYEIQELIGFGGMAIVFKAFDIKENRYVAVKILKDEYLQNEDFKRRFRNESKAIALLSHPNIVKVLDVDFSDTIQYIVMEYIDGITLKEYIAQQKVVNWKEAVYFTIQILRALQHAHDNGIVHRDIKPQNVMLLEDGTIKVMDFGIARFARESGRTLSDKAIGSVHYISPEQARGEATDEKTDIYAVGVILYEMLTGTVPFDGDTPVSIAIKQMQAEAKRPTLVNPNIPFGLEEIILRAMQKDSQLRYQTAAEMLRDIDEFKHNPDVVFEYKYFNRDGTTKYFDRINVKNTMVEEGKSKKKSYTMNILAGVAAACVILMCFALYFFLRALSNKPQTLELSSLVGMTYEEAVNAYPTLNIRIGSREESAEYDVNVIIDQSPKPTTVRNNSEVVVVVSEGLKTVTVPDLTNETAAKAKKILEEMGLVVEQIGQQNDTIEFGYVITTDPPADAEMQVGDTVLLLVSQGTADLPVYVPNLDGLTETEARAELIRLGLLLRVEGTMASNAEVGTVVYQDPGYNQKVYKGDTIRVKLSNGMPVSSTIPLTIQFPENMMDTDVTMYLYINGELYDYASINPAYDTLLTYEFELEDGLINGEIPAESTNQVSLRCYGLDFATYYLDFTANEAIPTLEPQFGMFNTNN